MIGGHGLHEPAPLRPLLDARWPVQRADPPSDAAEREIRWTERRPRPHEQHPPTTAMVSLAGPAPGSSFADHQFVIDRDRPSHCPSRTVLAPDTIGDAMLVTMRSVKLVRNEHQCPMHEQVAAEHPTLGLSPMAIVHAKGQRPAPARDMRRRPGRALQDRAAALRMLRDDGGPCSCRRGRGVTVSGEPERGIVGALRQELRTQARRFGYQLRTTSCPSSRVSPRSRRGSEPWADRQSPGPLTIVESAIVFEATCRGTSVAPLSLLSRCHTCTLVPRRSRCGLTEIEALRDDGGSVWSAQLSTGDAVVLMGPERAEFGTRAVSDPSWASSRVFVYVDDVDGHFERLAPSVRRSSPNLPITVPTAFTLPPIVVGNSGSSDRRRIENEGAPVPRERALGKGWDRRPVTHGLEGQSITLGVPRVPTVRV